MTINVLMAALVAELEADEIPMPLAQRFTLANVWADLARLAGEELPPEVLAIVGQALDVAYEPVRRGGYADHAMQFAPAD
ncbi:MAG TPA: hypothetical protein VIL85_12675 [Thermomicrobiales bacterium]|jgi:hypothetical protein